MPTHEETASDPWEVAINDHPGRTDSPTYVKSRALMIAMCKEIGTPFWGPGPWQDHHSGVLWAFDTGAADSLTIGSDGRLVGTWRTYRNNAGMEWSMQFCADPAKVELLRQNAAAFYAHFPATLDKWKEMGHEEQIEILQTPITDATGVGVWTDSIFNASQPLAQPVHTGKIEPGADGSKPIAGIHYYPMPSVWDAQFFKFDSFVLIVTDEEGNPAAVAPVAPPGSGDSRVQVVSAHPGSKLEAAMTASHASGQPHILDGSHPMAQAAFAGQAATA